jgi:beta-lactamase class A
MDLQNFITELPGHFGVYAKNLTTGQVFAFGANDIFPSASVIKVPILIELYRRVEEHHISLDHLLLLRKEDQVGGSGVLKDLSPNTEYSLRDLAMLMISVSDNTATNLLIEFLGIDSVNTTLRRLGAENTELVRPLQRVPAGPYEHINHTTAADMALLMERLATGGAISFAVSIEMVAILLKCQGPVSIIKSPPEPQWVGQNLIIVAHKTGSLNQASHDVGIVYSPRANYVAALLSDGAPYARLLTRIKQIGARLGAALD